jgi:hypothetical protein
MSDQVVYDMASQSEQEPNIFVKKDWISILDNMNGNYSSNQSVIDTSQLSNSNKWINYREAYLVMPLTLCLATTTASNTFNPTAANAVDYGVGLKNSYFSMIHSLSVDLAGTTICQQTPFQSLWNNFRLLTTLSYQDLLTLGPSIGFYPDNSSSWSYNTAASVYGSIGVSNNVNNLSVPVVTGAANSLETSNTGLYQRQRAWNFNVAGLTAPSQAAFSALISQTSLNTIYKSNIIKVAAGIWQCQIVATIMLRHLHSFFDKLPLVKGCFMKLTLNLNNSVCTFNSTTGRVLSQTQASSSFPLGGVNPLLISSAVASSGMAALQVGVATDFVASICVGATALDATARTAGSTSGFLVNMSLVAPCYTFNPQYEQAYLANVVRKVDYTDIYQYQVLNVPSNSAGGSFNNLITNGIAGLKSVLVIPFHSPVAAVNNGISPLQSAFDSAGGGTTSPLTFLNNFNVVISGQNALYNSQRYTYEEYLNQLIGCNGVNGSQVDGLSSGLISQYDFESCYNYYYVNVERCLPVERGVSKSVNIIGQNMSAFAVDLYVFVEYSVSLQINIITGNRV